MQIVTQHEPSNKGSTKLLSLTKPLLNVNMKSGVFTKIIEKTSP